MGGKLGETVAALTDEFNKSQKEYKVNAVFKGSYPDTVGPVEQTEPWTNFFRALTPGNPASRIHFNLDPKFANPTNDLKLTVQFCCIGAVDATVPSTHDITITHEAPNYSSRAEYAGTDGG